MHAPWVNPGCLQRGEGKPRLRVTQTHQLSHPIFSNGDKKHQAPLGSWETRPLEAQSEPTGLLHHE